MLDRMNKLKIKDFSKKISFKKAIWLAPLIYLFHFLEELVFGFYEFMNIHLGGDFNLIAFIIANMLIMSAYIFLIALFTFRPSRLNAFFVLTLISAAQFFNAFYHLLWTIVFKEYCPGVVTGFALYIPFVSLLLWIAYREEFITKTSAILIIILGAILMTLFEMESLRLLVFPICLMVVVVSNIFYERKTKTKN